MNSPSIVVLSIGSNDLGACSVSTETVCDRLLEFVSWCMHQGVHKTVVLQLLPRNAHYSTFNDKVSAVNDQLREESTIRDSLYLCEHSRQNFNSRFLNEFVDSDGVHMNSTGLVKFYTSVRGAVLWVENHN